jgi:hypothetical protein
MPRLSRKLLRRLLCLSACVMLLSFVKLPVFAQYPAPKPTSPGEMAAIDKDKAEKRAACQREARAQKLSYLKRRQFVRNCSRR